MNEHDRAMQLAATRLDFPLASIEERDLEAHLAACPDCRRRAAGLARDAGLLSVTSGLPAPSGRVRAGVMRAASGREPVGAGRSLPAVVGGLAVVAVALVVGVVAGSGILQRPEALVGGSDSARDDLAASESAGRAAASDGEAASSDGEEAAESAGPSAVPSTSPRLVRPSESAVVLQGGGDLGVRWQTLGPSTNTVGIWRPTAITYDEGLFVMVGQAGECDTPDGVAPNCRAGSAVSREGIDWHPAPDQDSLALSDRPVDGIAGMLDLTAGPAGFVAIGNGGQGDGVSDPAIWVSRDGLEWERVALGEEFAGAYLDTAIGGPDAYVIVGRVETGPEEARYAAWRSEDGQAWRRAPDPLATDPSTAAIGPVTDVARVEDTYVAIGPAVWRSDGGIEWKVTDGPRPGPGDMGELADVTPGGDGFLLLRSGCGNSCLTEIWSSRDGRSWELSASPDLGPVVLRRFFELPSGRLAATGVDSDLMFSATVYSDDGGKTWSPASLDGADDMNYEAADIALGGGRLVGIGGYPEAPLVISPPR